MNRMSHKQPTPWWKVASVAGWRKCSIFIETRIWKQLTLKPVIKHCNKQKLKTYRTIKTNYKPCKIEDAIFQWLVNCQYWIDNYKMELILTRWWTKISIYRAYQVPIKFNNHTIICNSNRIPDFTKYLQDSFKAHSHPRWTWIHRLR